VADVRRPGSVPDDDSARPPFGFGVDVTAGIDTDTDGRADTLVTDDGIDLILLTDFDGDSFADRVLRIGPDGITREVGFRVADRPDEADHGSTDDDPPAWADPE
jgi:hypothetical protein